MIVKLRVVKAVSEIVMTFVKLLREARTENVEAYKAFVASEVTYDGIKAANVVVPTASLAQTGSWTTQIETLV